MGNLGLYQFITTFAKKVGGPLILMLGLFTIGVICGGVAVSLF